MQYPRETEELVGYEYEEVSDEEGVTRSDLQTFQGRGIPGYPETWEIEEDEEVYDPITHSSSSSSVSKRKSGSPEVLAIRLALPDEDAKYEIGFWSQKMQEHMNFYASLITEDDKLQDRAKVLAGKWETYRKHYLDKGLDIHGLVILLQFTSAYKNDVLNKLRKGYYLGPIFQSFVEETLHELDYFVDTLNGEISEEEELEYWNKHSLGHALLNTRLIDPSEMAAFEGQLVEAGRLHSLSSAEKWAEANCAVADENQCMLQYALASIQESDTFLEQIKDLISRSQPDVSDHLSSIFPRALLKHTKEEVEYGTRKMLMLLPQNGGQS